MTKMGKFSADGLKQFQKQISKMQEDKVNAFVESCAKELAARLLRKVIKRTPVGQYPKSSGKKGGTLRRGWTAKTHEDAEKEGDTEIKAKVYANSLEVEHNGGMIVIHIVNPVEYASYVEYGHRTSNGKGWVQGRFILTVAEEEIKKITPKVLENKLKKFLGKCFK